MVRLKGSRSKTYITIVIINGHVPCAIMAWQNLVEVYSLAEFGRSL